MFNFFYSYAGNRRKLFKVNGEICTIGSARSNDLVIDTRTMAKRHAEFRLRSSGVHVTDLGSLGGTWVNRERVQEYGPLSELDEISIGDVSIALDGMPVIPDHIVGIAVGQKTESVSLKQIQKTSAKPESQYSAQQDFDTNLQSLSTGDLPKSEELAQRAIRRQDKELAYWCGVCHDQLLHQMDLRRKDVNRMSDEDLREEAAQLITQTVSSLSDQIPKTIDLNLLKSNVLNEAVGLGPLERFLDDDDVTEIMVNNHTEIFLEKDGKIVRSRNQFSNDAAVYAVIERIITPIGRRIDESSPIVDARLKDGSRVNAVIPPIALKGPSMTIRKFPKNRMQFSDLISFGSANQQIVDFFKVCVESHKNIIVAGGTGSGKTTLLNVLSNFIPDTDRIVTIEDAAELSLAQPNLVSLESRPSNLEGKGGVPIRDLVTNSLRMRPDRIVIGECRGGEAIDMLQAMNTGHDGSLTTIHANTPRDVISRLEVLVLMAGLDLPVAAIREQVASAVHLIVQQTRFPCGSRKISKVTEVVGVESGTVQLQDIFEFRQQGIDSMGKVTGVFQPTGFIPTFYDELRAMGKAVDISCFNNSRAGEIA